MKTRGEEEGRNGTATQSTTVTGPWHIAELDPAHVRSIDFRLTVPRVSAITDSTILSKTDT